MTTLAKFRGAVLGTAIGDALGAPMETMWAKDIKAKYPNFEKDGDYVSSETRKAGEWTDDTQLMMPIAWSIIYKSGIHPKDIADQYVRVAVEQKKRGWGRSTIKSVEQLAEGKHWFEASEESLGIGNGAAMKAAPLGLMLSFVCAFGSATDIRHCLNSIVDVGKITHKDIGIRAGFLQSVLITMACFDLKDRRAMIQDLKFCEKEYFGDTILSTKVEDLTQYKTIYEMCDAGGLSSKAIDSWPTTAAVYLSIAFGDKPLKALFHFIAQGGDCDTTGAMLGSLIGARMGVNIFPLKLLNGLEKANHLLSTADALHTNIYGSNITNKNSFSFRKALI